MTPETERLLESAFRRTLESFGAEVRRGERDPAAELGEYRRRRRDYATQLRMESVPGEAKALVERLLDTHGLQLDAAARSEFERDVTRMLVRLYDRFIESADTAGDREAGDQGSR